MSPSMRPGTVFVAAFLLATTVAVTFPRSASAGPESDIPGIPLPAPSVSGQLGGPIYDVVYRIQVPAEYVVVAGLTGTAGTDFDLYLFDGSATTVVNNVGVVAKSTGPTSDESLVAPSKFGGTYYLDINGATNVQGTYTLTVQVVADPSPPTLQVRLDGGRAVTNDPLVSLTIVASDDLSGVTDVALSGDGLTYQPWIPYVGRATWQFDPADGVKRVWVKARNGVGLESEPFAASIVLDTVQPTVVSVSPEPNSVTTILRPIISVTFSKPLDPATWQAYAFVLQSTDGTLVRGTLAYYITTKTGTFVPDVDLTPGVLYFATVGAAKDLAGNVVATTGSWWLKPLIPTSVSMATPVKVLTFGEQLTLKGTTSAPPGDPLSIEARGALGQDFATVTTVTPSDGHYSAAFQPPMNATYRVSYPGSATAQSSISNAARVLVRWRVLLSGRGPAIVRTGSAGQPITIQARVAPVATGQAVSFQLYRYDAGRRAYVYVGSRGTKTLADGNASIGWTPLAGKWQWRVIVPPALSNANGSSATYSWSISR
jgi:hypothetical protein